MKLAYLETLRHSTPIVFAKRFARHEVERFGRLLPAGALVLCCAGAANRDPEIFADPDQFIVDRKDLCQREPRGHYRADGLESLLTGNGMILEINGLASLPPHLTVPGTKLIEQWKIMYRVWTHAYAIGDANIAAGCQPYSFVQLVTVSLKHLVYRIRFVLKYRLANWRKS